MYHEADLLPISALQHLAFCPRQCALIHLEQVWLENRLTIEGRHLHEKAHEPKTELVNGLLVARSLRLRSLRLGLAGIADVVEFGPADPPGAGVALPGRAGRWRPFPVEYKRGRAKKGDCDDVQLCAQALCLEEMLGIAIPEAALYYGQPRRRTAVPLSPALRSRTESIIAALHALIGSGLTPPGIYEKKCDSCSLISLCRPAQIKSTHSALRYLHRELNNTA